MRRSIIIWSTSLMYARIFPPPPFPCELAQVLRNCHQSHLLLDLDFVRQFWSHCYFKQVYGTIMSYLLHTPWENPTLENKTKIVKFEWGYRHGKKPIFIPVEGHFLLSVLKGPLNISKYTQQSHAKSRYIASCVTKALTGDSQASAVVNS